MFELKNLGQYHDLYLKTGVLLLCDVFGKFISVCLADYGLHPTHFYSSPALSWCAMLKMAGVRFEKIDNIDVHIFLEKGVRGGVSNTSKRHSKSDEDTDIMYWDMNNLYGTIMSQFDLPTHGFKFLSKEEIKGFDLYSIPENNLVEYILEVDLEYPNFLRDSHNDPLCAEKIEVSYEMLSNYCKEIVDWYNIKVGGVKKLIPDLSYKAEYVVRYKNLLYYLLLGMKLVKIHRILSFKQSNWLTVFTGFNTEKRKRSNVEFSKNLYKLLNNCIYGKSIENIRKIINIKLINDKRKY